MSTILLNIGNTNCQIAWLEANGELGGMHTVPTSALPAPPLLAELAAVPGLAACVVPRARAVLSERFPNLRFLALDDVPFVDFSLVDPSTLGADRLANLAAAAELGGPRIVLDCGTAITTEVLDEKGRFRGGAILPGRRLLRQALHDHTAQLPLVPLGDLAPPAIGPNTAAAILAGTDAAVLGAVAHLLEASRREIGCDVCPMLAVGGDAAYFARHLPDVAAGPADFTLRGLRAVLRRGR
ncbi:MAG: type III pantothenate kinase [Lentisphaeria bacterium]|jgi:type III pantothenate kinase|nr:type III pantothenate kinase [Lentisphaeria bacterium]